MADRFLSLLDMTARDGNDEAVGLIEEVNTVAPEIESLFGRPIDGTLYENKKRTALPASPVFRSINEGTDIVSSKYEKTNCECFLLDGQLSIDEGILTKGKQNGNSRGDIFADEATGIIQQKAIALGSQFYNGNSDTGKGFDGVLRLVDSSMVFDAGGAAANVRTSVWIVWNHIQGLHWIWGNGKGLVLGEWFKQQVKDSNSKSYMAWVNNMIGWIGLGFGHTKSIARIKNIDSTANHTLTDQMISEAISLFPIFMRRQMGMKIFMNSRAQLQLQKSRTAVAGGQTDSLVRVTAPPPTESNGLPIILTDSIGNIENS